jgi:hypothetical protein
MKIEFPRISNYFKWLTSRADAMINKIQGSTLRLMDQVWGLQGYLDEPATLKPKSFQALRSECDKCCIMIVDFLDELRQELQKGILMQKSREPSISTISVAAAAATPQFSPKAATALPVNLQSQIGSPVSPIHQSRFPGKPPQFNEEMLSSYGYTPHHRSTLSISSSQAEDGRFSIISGISESPITEQMPLIPSQRWIPSEEVQRHVMKTEEFLERRRQSKVEFQEELQVLSKIWSSSPSSDGGLALASTLKLPGFGINVADGIEPIKRESSSTDVQDGLMLVNETNGLTPTSTLSVDCAMRQDSSFSIYGGGFCEGAKMACQGQKSYKVVKRPQARNFTPLKWGKRANSA